MVRIIVCGSRTFNDKATLDKELQQVLSQYQADEVEIVSGHARGADTMAEQFASEHGLTCKVFPAQWDKYGKRAGYLRNSQMLDYAAAETPMVVAFWDGESRGTEHTIKEAQRRNIKCRVILYAQK